MCECWIPLKGQSSRNRLPPPVPPLAPPIPPLPVIPKTHHHVRAEDQQTFIPPFILLFPPQVSIPPPLPLPFPFSLSTLLIGTTDCAGHFYGTGPYPWHLDPAALRPPWACHSVPWSTLRQASNGGSALPAA